MRAKPILFNTEMTRAILDGGKTVTRRKIGTDIINFCDMDFDGKLLDYQNADGDSINPAELCPYQPEYVMYVRETFAKMDCNECGNIDCDKERSSRLHGYCYKYKADGEQGEYHLKWHPSIHMPKDAARIWLRVTDVRVEKLQDMKMSDMRAEGMVPPEVTGGQWQQWQQDYAKPAWDSTIKKSNLDRYGWAANPWVWVIEFERCEKPENV